MKVVGITGSLCAGKSSAIEFFRSNGVRVFDADSVVQDMYRNDINVISEVKVVCPNAFDELTGINKPILRELIVKNHSILDKLTAIVQKHIRERMVDFITSSNDKIVVLEVPLLFEGGWDKYCDYIIAVVADKDIRIKRAVENKKMNIEIFNILNEKQIDDVRKIDMSDFVIYNNNNKNEFIKKLNEIFSIISKK